MGNPMRCFRPRNLIRTAISAVGQALPCCGRDERLQAGEGIWSYWGRGLHNTHFAPEETTVGPRNVATLEPRWVAKTWGDVSAIPTVSTKRVYFPDWGLPLGLSAVSGGSRLHALDRFTGRTVWRHPFCKYQPNPLNQQCRTSPAIFEDLLIVGDQLNQTAVGIGLDLGLGSGATLYGIDRANGALVWKVVLDANPLAMVTQSPVVFEGRVYVGVSSQEELAAARPCYPCCTFRGSMLAVDARTGRILWKTYMVPDNFGQPGGFSGASVWGSAPCIDEKRRVVYIATGNNYSVPSQLTACLRESRGDMEAMKRCLELYDSPQNYMEAIVALDLDTGQVRWARKLGGYDAWTLACQTPPIPWLPSAPQNCANPAGLDYDFGQAPMLFTTMRDGVPRELVGAGQKSGIFWALDPDRQGETVWATMVGPGGFLGGMEMGSATDGRRVFVQITNFDHTPFTLIAGPQAGQMVDGGIWAALDAATGQVLWQTPDPAYVLPKRGLIIHPTFGIGLGPGFFAASLGPVTLANGLLYAGSMDLAGHMYALSAEDGRILWRFASGGSVGGAPSIVDGMLYWGSGYKLGSGNHKLYAFGLPG